MRSQDRQSDRGSMGELVQPLSTRTASPPPPEPVTVVISDRATADSHSSGAAYPLTLPCVPASAAAIVAVVTAVRGCPQRDAAAALVSGLPATDAARVRRKARWVDAWRTAAGCT